MVGQRVRTQLLLWPYPSSGSSCLLFRLCGHGISSNISPGGRERGADRPTSGCAWARSSMPASMVSGCQTWHIDWRRCSTFRKVHADQAAIPHLLWEIFHSGHHHFPILITVRFTSCSVSDDTSLQVHSLSFLCIPFLLCGFFSPTMPFADF